MHEEWADDPFVHSWRHSHNAEWFDQMRKGAKDIRASVSALPGDAPTAAKAFTEKVQAWMLKTLEHYTDPSSPPFIILALGSFARKEMAPHSDMDFIVLCDPKDQAKLQPMLEAYGKTMRQNLLDRHGGFSIDDVTGSISSPEAFQKTPGRDAVLIYQNSPAAQELYKRFQATQQGKANDSKIISSIQSESKRLWQVFTSRFLKPNLPWSKLKLSKGKTTINVKKDVLEPILTPITLLAEYYDLHNTGTPGPLTTAERLATYIDDKKLRAKMLDHFNYFLGLRYAMHNTYGEEHDDLSQKDQQWNEVMQRLEKFHDDYQSYIKFITQKATDFKD